jgi:hypothetical protein
MTVATALHRQLTALYCPDPTAREVTVSKFRIDAVVGPRLIEIQCSSLARIRRKVSRLIADFPVTVAKPLVWRKRLLRRERKNGPVVWGRISPKREDWISVFDDLVHFVGVFPHPNLIIDVLLIEVEEYRRYPGTRKFYRKPYVVEDRRLVRVIARRELCKADDLLAFLPAELAEPFTTADLATAASIPRWLAQKAAFCLRCSGAVTAIGKRNKSWLYVRTADVSAA